MTTGTRIRLGLEMSLINAMALILAGAAGLQISISDHRREQWRNARAATAWLYGALGKDGASLALAALGALLVLAGCLWAYRIIGRLRRLKDRA